MNVEQLEEALEAMGVERGRYDLGGGIPNRSEGLVLSHEHGRWIVRHFERGSWYVLQEHASESEACQSFLGYASDPFYRA